MNTFLIITNVVILLLLISLLIVMHKKHVSFSKRVFTGLALGILFGLVLHFSYGATSDVVTQTTGWFAIIGTGYVKLLQMIAMPLVFISIIAAFTKIIVGKNFGKMAGLIIFMLVGTTAVAAAVGIASASGFNLDATSLMNGSDEQARGSEIVAKTAEMGDRTMPQQIIDLLPANPFLDLTGARATSTIGVVIFAAFLGFAYLGVRRKDEKTADTIKTGIDAIYALVMNIVKIVLRLTPFGILAIMTSTVATSDFGAIYNMGKFVIASYVALIAMFVIHLIIVALTGVSPLTYLKKTAPVLLFAFTSRSSAGALPLNIQTQTKRLGVPDSIANFAASFGVSIGQNGCAGVYPAMLAVMIAPTVNINPLEPTFLFTLIAVVAISSFGVAGVGGGATFAAIIVLSAMDLPVALAGILISVEPLIDMGRTALNVSGSMVSGLTTARVTGEIDKEVLESKEDQDLAEV
ncbi:L-cystine transporter [Kurthia sibirica]|uniref:L-cystine uptake protein TcyP n=1 Tax=Kurthia sibirica TaxID=202750 RepID=A0A2U3AK61_9BACL|nr:L-cystine transporter [Kurthia sibirica]PWI24905.1 L-cystine transporter [Kurthia sibirica]GEK33186.1 L-cystine uptake protein TcyP [Kurthia sibirica]